MKNLVLLFALLVSAASFGQYKTAQNNNQKTEAPYLEISEANAIIPLLSSKADVHITGTIAHVKLTQVYHNEGTIPIEAKYVFPMSTQAAIHDMKMKIGDRVVNAKIFEKQKAEKVYNDAVKEGKRAAKLDQSRPNVFQMKVGNIMPSDRIAIDIYYTEMLTPINGEYQFVAPGVVGPRFTGENTSGEETFNQPYTKKGIADTFDFDMNMSINAGVTIQNVASSSHKINVTYPKKDQATVFLSKSNINPANRDFILNYSLRGNAISSGLLLYEHDNVNYFAYMMEPPAQVQEKNITAREYLFIVDVSGSMNGYPLEVSKNLMRNLLCNLHPDDTFNVQLFASSSTVYSSLPVTATENNIEDAIKFLSNGQGGGGTELLSALNVAYKLPRADAGSARSMVVITDGYVTVEKEAFKMIEEHLDEASVFTFGIGSSVNRHLIEGMAKVSNSQSFIATSQEEASDMALKFKEYIASPLLTQVKFETKGFEVYDVEPKSIPDVFSARPVVIYGKYKGEANGKIMLTGYQGRKRVKQTYKVADGNLSKENKALRYLWARKKIERLDDLNTNFYTDVKPEVIALGLEYNLATKYTSFVAVDELIVNPSGNAKKVNQLLPMPMHVENSAVGAAAKVTGKSIIKKSYTLTFDKIALPKNELREIKVWFKATFGKLTSTYVSMYGDLEFKFGKDGELLSVSYLKDGKWITSAEMLQAFQTQQINKNKVAKQVTIKATTVI
ncbi:inter-alpha-trypsin inhibitor domain-containing protein [Patiriisocius marinistellae]|uniref:Inter-alpha-trypsin inhibitor domain-containing protein n=1 Tax=Patiriisocius marinistellae TaxID=2494560 RepID=A0A5J4FY37_9FLAO|nr:VIT domain-containing protein [Patiriisocius marinistellae]GEQ85049.1 inter-alpha-trypsin inhibitor domain-containing protein [Patiriisocius marinistellae]